MNKFAINKLPLYYLKWESSIDYFIQIIINAADGERMYFFTIPVVKNEL